MPDHRKQQPPSLPRRVVLGGMAGFAVSPWVATPARALVPLRVGVVGGGIVGVSIALHLALAGARVTLFEKTAVAAGATSKSFAWLNAYSTDTLYRRLRLASIAAWHEMDRSLGLGILWGGAIFWERNGADADMLSADITALRGTGYPLHTLTTAALADLAPEIDPGPFTVAAHSSIDGHLDPLLVTRKFLDRAIGLGVSVRMPCTVETPLMHGARLDGVRTSCGDIPLDRLVVAAGIDTPELTRATGYVPALVHAPGILAHSEPGAASTSRVVYGPGIHFKQFADGRIVGADSDRPPRTPVHDDIWTHVQDFPDPAIAAMHAERILGKIGDLFPPAKGRPPVRLTLGFRPMPKDGLPVIGPVPESPDISVAVMHSGVTLAPIVGQLVAREIMENTEVPDLAPFRPDRAGVQSP